MCVCVFEGKCVNKCREVMGVNDIDANSITLSASMCVSVCVSASVSVCVGMCVNILSLQPPLQLADYVSGSDQQEITWQDLPTPPRLTGPSQLHWEAVNTPQWARVTLPVPVGTPDRMQPSEQKRWAQMM